MAKSAYQNQPPLTHQILWALDRELWQLFHVHSVRQLLLADWLYAREQKERERRHRSREHRQFRQRLQYLQRVACITESQQGQRKVWKLTTKGKLMAFASAAHALVVGRRNQRTNGRATGQWLVIFDIPEQQRRIRDLLRRVLYAMGGRYVQRSVFLINDADGYRLVRHIVRVARLEPHVAIARVTRFEP